MEVEIVEFYPDPQVKKGLLTGTLHAYICDLGIDIRGIIVKKRKENWYFGMPSRSAIDPETNGIVRYPVFSFSDKAKTDALIEEIRTKGRKYIEEKLKQELCSNS
jgi:hypothetical protein